MSNVISLGANARHLNAARNAINERARSVAATDRDRVHALGVAFTALREGRSTATAVALGNAELRPARRTVAPYVGPGPEAA